MRIMKISKIPALFLILILSSCSLLLGPEPDTSPEGILKSLWDDFNNIHAYLDIRMSQNTDYNDWHDVYYNQRTGYAHKIRYNMSERSLFNVCASMLRILNDPHVGLYMPDAFASSYTDDNEDIFSLETVKLMLKNNGTGKYKNFYYGIFDLPELYSNIGYIHIIGFTEDNVDPMKQTWGLVIDNIINDISGTDALILDIRNNRGGHVYAMEYIAARFASSSKEYLLASNKNGSGPKDFQSPRIHIIKPANTRYTKPIILLTNNNTVSVSERFTLALRTQEHIIHAGTVTRGALSVRIERPMVNGWFYSISPERVTDMNGKIYEGIGVVPDVHIEYGSNDMQIREAIKMAILLSN